MSIFIKKITQMSKELIHLFPEVDPTEFSMLEQATYGLNSEQLSLFASIYRSRRKDPQLVLITCLIGLIGFAGICLLYTSPSPRDLSTSRMPSSA